MNFAGATPSGYEYFVERVAPRDVLAGLARLKRLRRHGWDVEALGAVDGSSFVLLGLRYFEVPPGHAREGR